MTFVFDPHILTDPFSSQCAQRHLKCKYPLETRRRMRKGQSIMPHDESAPKMSDTD